MTRLLPFAILAFKLWMLFDAHKRRAAMYWYPIIFFVPFGGVYYFLTVKMAGVTWADVANYFRQPPTLAELRYRARETPSIANRLALARGLYDAGAHAEALTTFESLLDRTPDDSDALHGVGLCYLATDEPARAVEPLARLIDINPGYRDYVAWPDLAQSLFESGQPDHAIEVAQNLVKKSPRVSHKVFLGQVLQEAERHGEARDIYEEALLDHEHAPAHVRRQNKAWAAEAEAGLQQLIRIHDRPAGAREVR